MDIAFIWLILGTATASFVLSRRWTGFSYIGGFLFILAGLAFLSSSVTYEAGESITNNTTSMIHTTITAPYSNLYSKGLSTIFMMLGMVGLLEPQLRSQE